MQLLLHAENTFGMEQKIEIKHSNLTDAMRTSGYIAKCKAEGCKGVPQTVSNSKIVTDYWTSFWPKCVHETVKQLSTILPCGQCQSVYIDTQRDSMAVPCSTEPRAFFGFSGLKRKTTVNFYQHHISHQSFLY